MTVRKRLASFHGWIELFQALDRLEAKIGSRERAEQKMYEYLRAPDGLPAKKWCQGGGVGRDIDIEPTHWSLPILQKARSKDGVDHGNLHCWYYVKLSRFEELCSAAFPNNTPSAPEQTPRHAGGAPAEHDWNAPNDSNGESPPGLSAAPGGALAHTEASQISAESAQQAGPWPEAPPANPAQQAESAGTKTAVRSRKRGIHAKPQQVRARKVLTEIYPNRYPTKDEVPDADLLDEFYKKYEQMISNGQLRKSRYDPPSRSSVLREAGRKAD